MKEKLYKYSAINLVILFFWTLYMFFDYYTKSENLFSGIGLFFNYFYTICYAIGLGIILLLIRLIFYLTKKGNPLKSNFFYINCYIFNLSMVIIWAICVGLDLIDSTTNMTIMIAISIVMSIFIGYDLVQNNFGSIKTN